MLVSPGVTLCLCKCSRFFLAPICILLGLHSVPLCPYLSLGIRHFLPLSVSHNLRRPTVFTSFLFQFPEPQKWNLPSPLLSTEN